MKRIDVNHRTGSKDRPFWMPWGLGGTIWRYLLFLIALGLFLWLLWWLMNLRTGNSNEDDEVRYEAPTDSEDPVIRDLIKGEDPVKRDIDNPVKELPRPDDNRLREVPDDDIITNPVDSFKRIVSTKLNVILNSEADDNTFNRFAQQFKRLYPDDSYYINYYNRLTKMIQLTVPAERRVYVKENLPSQISDIDFKIFYEEIFNNSGDQESYNDPAFSNKGQSWHFAPIQTYEAWDITKGSPEIVVAVIDSYIDVTHPELKGRITKPYSVERQSTNVLPPSCTYSFEDDESAPIYHGTHVAALAVGALDNHSGAAGLAPECTLMPVSLGMQMTSMSLLDGLLYAINQGADVVNLSIATYFQEGTDKIPVEDQLDYIMTSQKDQEDVWDYVFGLADQRNCTIVWAAGNCNVISGLDETKRGESTIRVSAVDPNLEKADFSNYGKYETLGIDYSDVSAPGHPVYSAGPGNAYGFCSGTSMAAPIVTGAVALMKSLNPKLTNAEIKKILIETGKPLKESFHIGNLIQVKDALMAVKGEFARFDDIKENPENIIGTWETTEERVVTDSNTGEPTGAMCHIFLKFTSTNGGTIYYKEDTGFTYSAPFTARFSNDNIYIDQNQPATSPDDPNHTFVPCHLICERGEGGLLKCRNTESDSEYYLIRSNL